MDNQSLFVEKLQDIVKLAKINKREVTKDLIDEYFGDLNLDATKIQYVYEYLLQENIKVAGYEENAEIRETVFGGSVQEEDEEESEYLGTYLNEIEEKGLGGDISPAMYAKAKMGDCGAKGQIIEQKLKRVIILSEELKNRGMSQSDLIQEGNIGLLLAVENLDKKDESITEDEYLDEEIRRAMLQALDEFRQDKQTSSTIIDKAERLKSEAEKLAEDLGDEMSLEDIAKFTGMDMQEMEEILRITGEN